MATLRDHGHKVAARWLDDWEDNKAGEYPEDAGYRKF
jgi:hypothetical protein